MKTAHLPIIFLSVLPFMIFSCSSNAQGNDAKTVIAEKDGYTLRYEHFQAHLASYYRMGISQMGAEEEKTVLIELVQEFMQNPEQTMATAMEELRLFQEYGDQPLVTNEPESTNSRPNPNTRGAGFQAFRKAAAGVGVQASAFEHPVANQVRTLIQNTTLSYEKVETYSGGGASYKEVILFCGDGRVQYQNNSGAGGVTGLSTGQSGFNGYWEVVQQGNNAVIMMYSTEAYALQINPQGFIPLMVKGFDQSAVRIASSSQDVLYRRSPAACQ